MRYWIGTLAALALVLLALWSFTRSGEPRQTRERVRTSTARAAELAEANAAATEARRAAAPRAAERTPLLPEAEAAFPRSELAGRVQHADGRPAAGIELEVRAEGSSERGRPLATHTCAADGSFRLTCLGRGPFQLRAHRSSLYGPRLQATLGDVPAGASGIVLTLPPVASLRGRVVDERGAPVRSFRLELEGPGQTRVRSNLQTRDGAFELEELALGAWTIAVEAGGHVPSEPRELVLPVEPVTIELVRECTLTGTVLGPDGRPQSSARVLAEGLDIVFTNAKGAFRLQVPPGEVSLRASVPGGSLSSSLELQLEPGQVLDDLELTLSPRGSAPQRVAELSTGEYQIALGEEPMGPSLLRKRATASADEPLAKHSRPRDVYIAPPDSGLDVHVRVLYVHAKPGDLEAIDTRGRVYDLSYSLPRRGSGPDAPGAHSIWFRQRGLPPGDYLFRAWTGERSSLHAFTLQDGPAKPVELELQLP